MLSKWLYTEVDSLRNTVFALLDPSGTKSLVRRTGRSPDQVFGGVDSFVKALNDLPNQFEKKESLNGLPLIPNLRLALNIAACDALPLVALLRQSSSELFDKDNNLVLSKAYKLRSSQAHFVLINDSSALEKFPGYVSGKDVYVLQPNTFGTTAKVIYSFINKDFSSLHYKSELAKGVFKKSNDHAHVREGKRKNIKWETQTPRTDGRTIDKSKPRKIR